jgi:anti-anti-sigma factor
MIRFEGDLDIARAAELREMILESPSADVHRVTLDLTEVKFIDSVGISLLVTAHKSPDGEQDELIALPDRDK